MSGRALPFQDHGVEFTDQHGDQALGTCPFCGRLKFYVNIQNNLWDCKRCGESGNLAKFLNAMSQLYEQQITEGLKERLATSRGLPWAALEPWRWGFDGANYTLPVTDFHGAIIDIRKYLPGDRMISTAGCQVGLLNAPEALKVKELFICEGEHDLMAMAWALSQAGEVRVRAVGVPGANTFKREWLAAFSGKLVHLAYDHDKAGRLGEKKAWSMLTNVASRIDCIHWPDDYPEGYDVRDYITRRVGVPTKAVVGLRALLRPDPRITPEVKAEALVKIESVAGMHPRDALAVYNQWLLLPDDDALLYVFGLYFARRIDALDMVWGHLVGSPGAAKSVILTSLIDVPDTFFLSSLTPKALASGAMLPGGGDPSLLPKLKDKLLIIKDLTPLLTMAEQNRQEVTGTLRDVYDGTFSKQFGTGTVREYRVSFGMLSGVTPAIDMLKEASLGERFLKFRMPPLTEGLREKAALHALRGADKTSERQSALKKAAEDAVAWKERPEKPPTLTMEQEVRIVQLARRCAIVRGAVMRDKYHRDEVLVSPIIEEPIRLAIQLSKLARGIGWFLGESQVGVAAMRVIEKVAMDTPPEREGLIAQCLRGGSNADEIARKVNLPKGTVYRRLRDMALTGLVEQVKVNGTGIWVFKPQIRQLFHEPKKLGDQR